MKPLTFPGHVVALALGVLAALNAQGATWYVDTANCPGPGDGTESSPFCHVQPALNAASHGDEILVAPGTYDEALDLLGKRVHLRGVGGPSATVLRHASGSVITCVGGETLDTTVEGFTIRDGLGTFSTNCTGGGPQQGYFGGGIYAVDSSLTVRDCILTENGNQTGTSIVSGAAIYVQDGRLDLSDSYFTLNGTGGSGTSYGSGVTLCGSGHLTVVDSTFHENGRENVGGGSIHTHGAGALVERCRFTNNTAAFGAGVYSLPGWLHVAATTRVRDCTFRDNFSSAGGGLFAWPSDGSLFELEDSQFFDNTASSGGGAEVYSSDSIAVISRCFFAGNEAVIGGGLSSVVTEDGQLRIENIIATDNHARGNGNQVVGGGMTAWIDLAGTIDVSNVTLIGNTAVDSGGGLHARIEGGGTVRLGNAIVRGNTPNQIQGPAIVGYSNVEGGVVGDGNTDTDAGFVDSPGQNFRLLPGSACIDAGVDPTPPDDSADQAGQPRFIDDPATPNGGSRSMIDMGALEFPHENLITSGADGITLSWPEVGHAQFYSVYRGDLEPWTDTDGDGLPDQGYGYCVIGLDPDTTDSIFIDPLLPDPGAGFFYLMAVVDAGGTESFLGSTSAGKQRQVETPCY